MGKELLSAVGMDELSPVADLLLAGLLVFLKAYITMAVRVERWKR